MTVFIWKCGDAQDPQPWSDDIGRCCLASTQLILVHGTGKARLITEYSDFKKYDVDTILKFGEPALVPK